MTKQKILQISQIVLDKDLYPRMKVDWTTSSRYYNALKSGAQFPPITVAEYEGKYILVDGAHRLQAFKGNKDTHIPAEILTGLDKKEIFIEAVKRNSNHGRQFNAVEVTQICVTLDKWECSQEQISELVGIPVDKLTPFVAKRITRVTGSEDSVPLKKALHHLSGVELDSEPTRQSYFNGSSQIRMVESIILLIEKSWIDTTSELLMEKIKKLKLLLEKY